MKSALPEDVEDEALGVANQSVIEGIIAIMLEMLRYGILVK